MMFFEANRSISFDLQPLLKIAHKLLCQGWLMVKDLLRTSGSGRDQGLISAPWTA